MTINPKHSKASEPEVFKKRPVPTTALPPQVIRFTDLSEDSQEIVKHFGIECPTLLNDYCCALEDVLIDSLTVIKDLQQQVKQLKTKQNE